MKFYVGVTDNQWFDFLSNLHSQEPLDEVNFWQPSPTGPLKSLNQGDLFLFKLHSPRNAIAGGGFFVYSTDLPVSLAWDAFEKNNGAGSFSDMRGRIARYKRKVVDPYEDFQIGCILLAQPFFLSPGQWFYPPEWSPNIVRGKYYDTNEETGKAIWDQIQPFLSKREEIKPPEQTAREEHARYGKETLVKTRLGQRSFKILVTDAYHRSCALTHERALPVLEAAHIKPYSESGPHMVNNGLLRSDLHKLFDKGYITLTEKHKIEVSRRIQEEFENGKSYYTFHGKKIYLPQSIKDHPSRKFITWHNENVFKG